MNLLYSLPSDVQYRIVRLAQTENLRNILSSNEFKDKCELLKIRQLWSDKRLPSEIVESSKNNNTISSIKYQDVYAHDMKFMNNGIIDVKKSCWYYGTYAQYIIKYRYINNKYKLKRINNWRNCDLRRHELRFIDHK